LQKRRQVRNARSGVFKLRLQGRAKEVPFLGALVKRQEDLKVVLYEKFTAKKKQSLARAIPSSF